MIVMLASDLPQGNKLEVIAKDRLQAYTDCGH